MEHQRRALGESTASRPLNTPRARSATRTIAAATITAATALSLTACVTNTEGGPPEGWEPVDVPKVDEIAAMVPDDVAKDGTLTVGTNPPFAPFEFKDSEGALIGAELDVAEAIAQTMGLEFTPVEQDFSLILPSIDSGQVELGVSGFTDTPERRESFDFVNFLYAGVQWATPTGKPVDPNNACGLTVAVQRTTVSETDDVRPKADACAAEGKKPLEILSYDTSDNAALAALVGRADALSADSPVAAWAVQKSDGKMQLVGDIFQAAPYGFAVPKDSELSLATATAMQHLIDTGEYQKILARWGIDEGLIDKAMINEEPIGKA